VTPPRVAVLVERTWDPFSVELDPATEEVEWGRTVSVPGPGSLDALELGLRLGNVAAFAIGGEEVEDVLRESLAMGAATAVRAADLSGLVSALRGERFDLVITSWRSGHGSPNPLGPLVAGFLDLPQATAVDQLALQAAGEVVVRRRLGRGELEELALPLPAVVAIEPGIVTPRLGSPAAVLAAREAAIPVLEPYHSAAPRATFLGHRPPRPPPPRTLPPDSMLSAEERIAEVVGLAAPERHRELVTGPPAELATRIVAFLEERGFL
jgi:electron transfer flavoprotein beta subunit